MNKCFCNRLKIILLASDTQVHELHHWNLRRIDDRWWDAPLAGMLHAIAHSVDWSNVHCAIGAVMMCPKHHQMIDVMMCPKIDGHTWLRRFICHSAACVTRMHEKDMKYISWFVWATNHRLTIYTQHMHSTVRVPWILLGIRWYNINVYWKWWPPGQFMSASFAYR